MIHDVSFEVLPFAAHIFLSKGTIWFNPSCGVARSFFQAFMARKNESSEADMGWQISVPEDDDLDLDPVTQSHGSHGGVADRVMAKNLA